MMRELNYSSFFEGDNLDRFNKFIAFCVISILK